ncbi:MFS transporter [Lachnellula willkommii]|uniref:MFS transporter n=1 Tax=Lachnellula willkommii TaxID=215461 RepID=A0A559ME44_9HELO|nr:MFS transporter [Lachnellula willkommii]
MSSEKISFEAVEMANPSTGEVTNFEGLGAEEIKTLEKKLVWKVDTHLITALFGIFIFNILDRSNIANARLGGMEKDLKLKDTQYQTAVSILFVGYLLGQIPSNLMLTRFKPSVYLPTAIIAWGTISTCAAATHNFAGIFVVRFLLGFAESPFFAGALLLVSSWYKPSEIAPRVALMYCGNTVANGFGGLLAAGILDGLDGARGIEGWRWLFIIEGAGTVLIGILAFLLMPDFPDSPGNKWLTEQERRFAVYRIASTVNGEEDSVGGIKQGLKDTVTDVKVWMLCFIQICLLSSQTWTYFFPSIVKTLGYSRTISLLLTAPVYALGFFTSLGNSLIAQRTGQRAILIMWPLTVDIVGNIMVITSHKTAVRYTGMFLMCMGSFSAFNVVQAWVGSTIPRTRTKRAVTYALVNMMGNLSNIYGSYFFPIKDSPQYINGGITLSSFAFGGVLGAVGLALYLKSLNKKALEEENADGVPRYRYLT